ncbi:hypothetical protein P171DRAFT_467812 [Karstenula rhodostoma CBS 690.94]|uniref:Uncharacterized protein n=1 Tax=Karstenula rhodostoma CBS 690.94 TaxID=1392251 RepID=A0A9P4PTN9_9PLEO|nr:hypothetical protein P171DRAFT_467812 [Karstenula rhodostoma CBS 690.94]
MAPTLAEPTLEELEAAKTIAGPFSQFNNSAIFEYLEPPISLNATCQRNQQDREETPTVAAATYPFRSMGIILSGQRQNAMEDTSFYMWAHPEAVPEPMDRLFFQSLLGFLSDVHEKKESMSILQIMVNQHASASAMVMFPRAWWLGPLRWWVPWKLQGLLAAVGRWFGYRGLIEKYTSPEEWQNFIHSKRT